MNQVERAELIALQRAEIDDLKGHLDSISIGDDLLGRLLRSQTEDRLHAVRQELLELEAGHLSLKFRDINAPARHSLDTALLSNLLSRFQKALVFTGWAQASGPGVAGTPPASVRKMMTTSVQAFAPGSFVVVLEPANDQLDFEPLAAALGDFLVLANAATGDISEAENVNEVAQGLGAKASRLLGLFFGKVAEGNLSTDISWSRAPELDTTITPAQAKNLSDWLNGTQSRFKMVEVRGILRSADTVNGRFILEAQDGISYEGRAARELLSGTEIDGEYQATMSVTTFRSERSGAEKVNPVLVSLARDGAAP